jgi:hypothetical protein
MPTRIDGAEVPEPSREDVLLLADVIAGAEDEPGDLGVEGLAREILIEGFTAPARPEPTARERCPEHGIPDCSPLLNGCSRLVARPPVEDVAMTPLRAATIAVRAKVEETIPGVLPFAAVSVAAIYAQAALEAADRVEEADGLDPVVLAGLRRSLAKSWEAHGAGEPEGERFEASFGRVIQRAQQRGSTLKDCTRLGNELAWSAGWDARAGRTAPVEAVARYVRDHPGCTVGEASRVVEGDWLVVAEAVRRGLVASRDSGDGDSTRLEPVG